MRERIYLTGDDLEDALNNPVRPMFGCKFCGSVYETQEEAAECYQLPVLPAGTKYLMPAGRFSEGLLELVHSEGGCAMSVTVKPAKGFGWTVSSAYKQRHPYGGVGARIRKNDRRWDTLVPLSSELARGAVAYLKNRIQESEQTIRRIKSLIKWYEKWLESESKKQGNP